MLLFPFSIINIDKAIIESFLSNITVVEGSNVTLDCNATGYPPPNITWTRDNGNRRAVLYQEKSFTISDITRQQFGEYTCTAWNGIGSNVTATTSVTVYYPTVIVGVPVNKTVTEGDNVVLFCNATGNPTPTINWTKGDSQQVLHQGSLHTISNVTRQAAGEYTCSAGNGVGLKQQTVAVLTIIYPSTIERSPSNTVAIEGDNVTLHCNTTGYPPPNITWTRHGSPRVLYQGETFNIINITREQCDDYTCTAWNGIGSKANATVTVTVLYRSVIVRSPSNISVVEGDNVTLHCNATGNPPANITWRKRGSQAVLYQGESFTITNITREQCGHYICTARNGIGNNLTVSAVVTVHYASMIKRSHSNTMAIEGDNVTVHCNATGNPPPNITWTRHGSPRVLYQGDTFTITNITRQQYGYYTCTAWNGIGSNANATATVTVHYPSVIQNGPLDEVSTEGQNVTLYCNATGNPTTNITWTKDGGDTVLYQGEMFTIVNIRRTGGGGYKCTAWNGVKENKTATARVTVHYPAVIDSSPGNDTVTEFNNASFFCNATGNPPPNITWTEEGNNTVLHHGESFIIERITREYNARRYRCTAQNGVLSEDFSFANVFVHFPPNVVIEQLNSSVVEGDNVSIVCRVTGNPPPEVAWIRNDTGTLLSRSNQVLLTDVRRNQLGLYQCLAWNGLGGNASSTIAVDVFYPAEIFTRPMDQVVWVEEQATLFCNATGNPAPNITYTVVGENGTVGFRKTLVINGSRTASVKTYRCTASNGIQLPATADATVTVNSRLCSSSPCRAGNCSDVNATAYECQCFDGFRGSNCDEPIPEETDVVGGYVTLRNDTYTYHVDYKNHNSERFLRLSESFKQNVTALYSGENQFGDVKVNNITEGSVVMDFNLVFLKRGNRSLDQLVQMFKSQVDNGSLGSIPVQRESLRLVLPTTAAPPTTTQIPGAPAAGKRKMETWIIALLAAIGGVIFLVMVCAVIHCCVHKKRKEKLSSGMGDKDDFDGEPNSGRWIDLPHMNGKGNDINELPGARSFVNEAYEGNGLRAVAPSPGTVKAAPPEKRTNQDNVSEASTAEADGPPIVDDNEYQTIRL